MMTLKELSNAKTPLCGDIWKKAQSPQRITWIKEVLSQDNFHSSPIEVTEAREDGQIILRFTQPVSADKRGKILLDFEESLKNKIDAGLTVWLESLGDKSSLRRLRGITVKP